MGINVALDGPSGAGKSTIAKMLAKGLNMFMWTQEHYIVPLLIMLFQRELILRKKDLLYLC